MSSSTQLIDCLPWSRVRFRMEFTDGIFIIKHDQESDFYQIPTIYETFIRILLSNRYAQTKYPSLQFDSIIDTTDYDTSYIRNIDQVIDCAINYAIQMIKQVNDPTPEPSNKFSLRQVAEIIVGLIIRGFKNDYGMNLIQLISNIFHMIMEADVLCDEDLQLIKQLTINTLSALHRNPTWWNNPDVTDLDDNFVVIFNTRELKPKLQAKVQALHQEFSKVIAWFLSQKWNKLSNDLGLYWGQDLMSLVDKNSSDYHTLVLLAVDFYETRLGYLKETYTTRKEEVNDLETLNELHSIVRNGVGIITERRLVPNIVQNGQEQINTVGLEKINKSKNILLTRVSHSIQMLQSQINRHGQQFPKFEKKIKKQMKKIESIMHQLRQPIRAAQAQDQLVYLNGSKLPTSIMEHIVGFSLDTKGIKLKSTENRVIDFRKEQAIERGVEAEQRAMQAMAQPPSTVTRSSLRVIRSASQSTDSPARKRSKIGLKLAF